VKRCEVDRTKLAPMMRQYMDLKDKYEDTIIFFRLGDFYEMFFEDAEVASRELELTLTGRNSGIDEKVPMCGIPYHAYLPYLEKLVDRGYKVAICEQLTQPDKKGMVERGIVQIVTKGTLMEQSSLDEKDNNFIGSIYDFSHCYAISYADISTGEIYTELLDYDQELLINEIVRKNMKEVIVSSNIDRAIINVLRDQYHLLISFQDQILETNEYHMVYEEIKDLRMIHSIRHLLYYLAMTKFGVLAHLKKALVIDRREFLEIDLFSKRNLELVETLRQKDRKNSLLGHLDKTKTAMGSRLLKHYIENPLTDKKEILKRQQMISKLLTEFILKEELRNALTIYDLERLVGRISYGNVNGRDLLQLKASLGKLPEIKRILTELHYEEEIETLDDVYDLLDRAICEDCPISIKEGNLIKEGYHKELDELRKLSKGGKEFILNLEQQEREKTKIKNLKIGYNKVFGYYIEVSKANISLVKEEYHYIRKQTLANAERYITEELKEKEDLILSAEEKSDELEYQLFLAIRDEIKKYIPTIQMIAHQLSHIDVMQSLAVVAEENNYVCPTIVDERKVIIKEGRHPVVEQVSKKLYVPNDIFMDEKTNILLITGPNMSGKSTYMRMFAIIIIMAQMGSFVPCKEATLPIFDKIFTRIGASDDLVSGESTFMVEMKEANHAVSNATERSLILFDELGRGTATYDGMSLAQAILEYIHDHVKAKTLFSTHYHELTSLEKNLRYLKNVHVSAKEENGTLTFLHKIKNGPVDKSYGIHVASLVHLPDEIIVRAKEILAIYEHPKKKKEMYEQTSLFLDFSIPKEESRVLKRLETIDPLKITPIEALNILFELKKDAEREKK